MKLTSKNNFELAKMRAAGHLAAFILDEVTARIQPGVSTLALNNFMHELIEAKGAKSATVGYKGYRHASCISINEVVCHGIPSDKVILKDGDILNIDVTVILDGFYGDTSRMYYAGSPSEDAKRLVNTTYEAMMAGINTVKSGSQLADIGKAIQAVADRAGYAVVKEYCGHGLGRAFHEEPQVLHYAETNFPNPKLKNGLTFTIEPMINVGGWKTRIEDDGWTVRTLDNSLSAQFEHSLGVTENGPEIFTLSPAGYTLPPYK
jgi:methionyl aminopeptidase